MGDLIGRFRFPLTYMVLALACVVALASQDGPVQTGYASQLLMEVMTPARSLTTYPFRKIGTLWDDYVDVVDAREELDTARVEILRLQQENLKLQEQRVSSERLSALDDLREQHKLRMIEANVSAEDLAAWSSSVVIDKGSGDGVESGMSVITQQGVVGVVSGTSPRFSQVLLITDPQSAVDAFSQRSRAQGSVKGRAGATCTFDYVERDADVQAGDLLLTSGVGGIHPRGLLVGTVESVERQPYGLFQGVKVKPAVDFRSLEGVFVILERREIPSDAEFSTAGEKLWQVAPGSDVPPAPPAVAAEIARPAAQAPQPASPAPAPAPQPAAAAPPVAAPPQEDEE